MPAGDRRSVRKSAARHPARRYRDGAARSDAARVCRLCRGSAADRLARGDQPSGLRRRPRASAERRGNATASPPSRRGFPAFRRAWRPPPASFSERRIISIWCVRGRRCTASTRCPGRPNPLRPVVRLTAKIIQIREIDSGESVGYGAAHVMQAPGRVATVAVGYADGWLRSLSGRGCGFIGGTAGSVAGPGIDGSLTHSMSRRWTAALTPSRHDDRAARSPLRGGRGGAPTPGRSATRS